MQIVYTRKPKIHMLQKGKAVCGRHWLDGEQEGSKFANSVDCKDCLRLLTKRAVDGAAGFCECGYMAKYPICTKCGRAYPPRH